MNNINDRAYEAIDNLEVMAEAINYSTFLTNLVKEFSRIQGAVADFGAGTGYLAKLIAEAGIEVVCIEPDPDLRELIRSRSLVAHSCLDMLSPESQSCIYSFNVLEHIEDDLSACRTLFQRLAPGGSLIVYVPACPILYTAMDSKVGHVRRYTRNGLVDLLGRSGFIVRRAEYVDSLGFFVTLAYKWFGNKKGDIDRAMIKFYDRYIFPLSRLCDKLFNDHFGKNILVVAEKSTGN